MQTERVFSPYPKCAPRGGNAKTDELKKLFAAVMSRAPSVTPCPEKDPYPDDGRIRAVYYEGEECLGRPARVFAYLGFPQNASAEAPVPGMVLVHGGGGHAFAEWVKYWVDNGYAAISMDGFGQSYVGPYGTCIDEPEYWPADPASHLPVDCFASKDRPFKEQWFYYYLADIMLANTVLRSDERVDPKLVGLTGISWGGIGAGAALCYDGRFAFAAPVYGCGFQSVSTTVWGAGFRGEGITDVWDAENLLGEVTMPVIWFNGDNDPFFGAGSTSASAAASPNGAATFISSFGHGHIEGIRLPEILRLANEQTGRGPGNIKINSVSFDGDKALLSFTLPEDVSGPEAIVYYHCGPLEYEDKYLKDPWRSRKGVVSGGRAEIPVPGDAGLFYLSVEGTVEGPPERRTIHATTGLYSADRPA